MTALMLGDMTWPEIRAAMDDGCDTVVVALGAIHQHGPHLPLGTDLLLGSELARRVADRLGAFVAPTVAVGCSASHLGFPGTISLRPETLAAIVADLVASFARGGLRRCVLLPAHGGNLVPLAAAVARLPEQPGLEVVALTDLEMVMRLGLVGQDELGVTLSEGGLHAGECETSMLLAIHPQAVRAEALEPGFVGAAQDGLDGLAQSGVETVAPNGVIGDPSRACRSHGERYWDCVVECVLDAL